MIRKLAAIAALTLGLGVLVPTVSANAATPCTAQIGGGCGAYSDQAFWPGSNGFNTYVVDQAVDSQSGSTGSITVTSPSSWTTKANYADCGGCVQTFNAVQQLTNNWGSGGFNGSSNMPLSALSKLRVTYTESAPSSAANQYEFAPDLWTNYGADMMIWVDTQTVNQNGPGTTSSRCDDNGGSASNIIGQVSAGGKNYTVYGFGKGNEIIFVLDGVAGDTNPMGHDTCAQQKSGTIPVLALLKWASNHGGVTGVVPWSQQYMTQFNTGYEITAGDGAQYSVTSLKYPLTIKTAV